MDELIKIELFGSAYSFAFRARGKIDRAQAAATYVVEQVERIGKLSKGRGHLDTMILVALNIADDYLTIKDKYERLINEVENRSNVLIQEIQSRKV
nr:cell division protein ZapA [Desulfobacterales bacterium]